MHNTNTNLLKAMNQIFRWPNPRYKAVSSYDKKCCQMTLVEDVLAHFNPLKMFARTFGYYVDCYLACKLRNPLFQMISIKHNRLI